MENAVSRESENGPPENSVRLVVNRSVYLRLCLFPTIDIVKAKFFTLAVVYNLPKSQSIFVV